MKKLSSFVSYSICVAAISCSTFAQATDLIFTADTSNINGNIGAIYLDFISGGNSTSNLATITAFSTDATLGAITPSGDVSGSFPSKVTLDTTSTFFNELALNVTFGNYLSFDLNLTQNSPNLLGTPDAFSVFVSYDGTNLTPTTDPTGSNALFLFNIDGTPTGNLNVYTLNDGTSPWQATTVTAVTAVPVPSWALWFLSTGLVGLGINARKQQRG